MSGWSSEQFKQFEANEEAYHARFDGVKFEDILREKLNCSFSEIDFANLKKGDLQTILQCVSDAPCDIKIPRADIANNIWANLSRYWDQLNDVVTYVDTNYGQTELLTVNDTVFGMLLSVSTSIDYSKSHLTQDSVRAAIATTLILIEETSTSGMPAETLKKKQVVIDQAAALCGYQCLFNNLDELFPLLKIELGKANSIDTALHAIAHKLTPFGERQWPYEQDFPKIANRCATIARKLCDVDTFCQEKSSLLIDTIRCLAFLKDPILFVYIPTLSRMDCWIFDYIVRDLKDVENKEFQSWLKTILNCCEQR